MKTLDEVIKDFEICQKASLNLEPCNGCSYYDENDHHCRTHNMADVLFYLKHLQEYYEMSREHHEPNPPLTWEELKSMEGKPVWVEEKYSFNNEWHGQWEVIRSVWEVGIEDYPYLWMTDDEYRYRETLGEIWRAYRKERS